MELRRRRRRRRGGAYTYRTIGNDVYVSITLRPSLKHATSFQSYVQGDKHLDLPDTIIDGVTEHAALTSGDYNSGFEGMPHVKKQSQQIPSYPQHRMSGPWYPMLRMIYTLAADDQQL